LSPSGVKALAKRVLFACGAAGLLHRRRNRAVLTTVMFHRVLPDDDPRAAGANPTYTVTPEELDACLGLFRRFHAVIGLAELEAAVARGRDLPARPLLITFDDGWADTVEHALPVLRAHGVPAVVFVATGHIGRAEGFWQEEVFDAVLAGAGGAPAEAQATVAALDRLAPEARAERLAALPRRALPRRMADAAGLAALERAGIAIGGHGHSHEPLIRVADPAAEFRACRETLARLGLGGDRPAFSFPHGQTSPALIAAARAAGFGLCFTSAPTLTPLAALDAASGIGRIEIDLRPLRGRAGLDRATLAFGLITPPHASGR
jgi:peptidoglycan/xylan/chitin deacetylase (PgdA/CDA1 family)